MAAWPTGLVFDARTREVAGFQMPRATGALIQHLYNPVMRVKDFPKASWEFQVHAAANIAAAFDEVHSWRQRGAGLKAQRTARFADAVLASGAGFLALAFGSAPLGVFLLIGGTAKALTDSLTFQAIDAQVRQMEDTRIQNEYFLDLLRERLGSK